MSNEIGDVVSARADEDPRDRSQGTAKLGGAAVGQTVASASQPHRPFTAEDAAANRLQLMEDPGRAKQLEKEIAVAARRG